MASICYFGNIRLKVWEGVYEPAEDSSMIAEHVKTRLRERVLDLGTGCGLLAIIAAKMGASVIATDTNPLAIACAMENARIHKVLDKIDFRLGNLFAPVKGEKFDLILFNPPYLPTSAEEKLGGWLELSWNGGNDGRSLIDKFLTQLPEHMTSRGKAFFVQSSLTDEGKTIEEIKKAGLAGRVISRKKYSFEEILLFECVKKPKCIIRNEENLV